MIDGLVLVSPPNWSRKCQCGFETTAATSKGRGEQMWRHRRKNPDHKESR